METGGDLSAQVGQAQAQMQESLAAQLQMQKASTEYEQQSTMAKMEFDTMQAGLQRLASIGEAVSRLTDQQSQQLAQ